MKSSVNKTRQWFEKDVLKLGVPGGGTNITLIGTCLHPESLLSELLRSPGWDAQKYQSVLTWSKQSVLWDTWKELYTNLSNPQRALTASQFYTQHETEMIAGTEVLWPEAEPYLFLMQMRVNEGIASFNSEKQNDPHDPNRQVFDMTLARRFSILLDPSGDIRGFKHESGKVVHADELTDMVAFHDPALGEGLAHDYSAIVVVAQDRDGYLYCLDAWIEKAKPEKQIRQAFQLHTTWQFNRLYLEDNNFQGLLKMNYTDPLQEYQKANHRYLSKNCLLR